MIGVIDRFEGSIAIVELESNKMINIDRERIPLQAKEGDVLNIDSNITINFEETIKRKRSTDTLTENIWK